MPEAEGKEGIIMDGREYGRHTRLDLEAVGKGFSYTQKTAQAMQTSCSKPCRPGWTFLVTLSDLKWLKTFTVNESAWVGQVVTSKKQCKEGEVVKVTCKAVEASSDGQVSPDAVLYVQSMAGHH